MVVEDLEHRRMVGNQKGLPQEWKTMLTCVSADSHFRHNVCKHSDHA